jgi:nucleoside-diphosphate-sugar epimerase
MKVILVIGAKGFVGSEIVKQINLFSNLEVIEAVRGDDLEKKVKQSDYVIHSANSPSRYNAKLYPENDFYESVEKTNIIYSLCRKHSKMLTLISSISARAQLDTVYGRNRRSCEYIVGNNSIVIRLGYMYSRCNLYGALRSIYEDKDVYLDENSSYSYSDVAWPAQKIIDITESQDNGIYELGARGDITLRKISDILGSNSKFIGKNKDVQIAKYTNNDNPSINDFVEYLEVIKRGRK